MMANQLGFVVEQRFCTGCKACQIACKDKNDLEVGQLWRRVTEESGGTYTSNGNALIPDIYAFWTSISCNHCQNPKCVENCPTGAMHKREEDGVVAVDQDKCIGCCNCVQVCPYGAPQYNPQLGKVGKCNLCPDYRAEGKKPACVAACPVRALHAGDLEELRKEYNGTAKTKGLPDPSVTSPSWIVMAHKDGLE